MLKKYSFLLFLVSICTSLYISCGDDNDDGYESIPVSPVVVDLESVPYPKLSDYKFFEGELKNLTPALGVISYEPASSLFVDYAHKKRFVWLPANTKATYNGDGEIIEFPVGSVLIKSFYYEHMQPSNTLKHLETRLMIRKANGWIFANYVWNDDQTEAYFNLDGSDVPITFIENGVTKSTSYRIPNRDQCITCHKTEEVVNGSLAPKHIPLAVKPQNLNWNYTYSDGSKNQLLKWIELDILEDNFSLPSAVNTVINYNDASQPIGLRARSYVDVNCAHCHTEGGHCSYRPMRFAFDETYNNDTNMGVCVNTQDMQDFPPALGKIVTPGNINRSMMYYRMNTTDEGYRMPLHGRTVIHEEGIALIEQWINSLQPCP